MCTADDDVWNRYIKAHPEAKIWRGTPFPLYDELSILYDGALAKGKREMSSNVPFTQPLTEEQISSHNTSNPKTLFPDSNERLEDINSSSNDDMGIKHLNHRLNSVNSIPPKDPYAYELCMEELQKMESLEEETFMQAIEVLRDRQYAIAFMTLKEPMRLKWLKKKCGGT
ncbi:hypothetical protein CKAN_02674500 [Cinnamomum micranthum f. kanehirae]|uniref:Uncharacterized protein n=1 Tax=Cinnamomum micranthum f. kanehirae TaxID=337451 RepID=A0A443Q2U0_9MAGN|nr:hypothetical protein CKAN_02674500 [Cinnamomum micranthum f. kanehirae]